MRLMLSDSTSRAEDEPIAEELATELAVAFFGFGVIAANSAFEFEQFQDSGRIGWRGGSSGYFSEDGWSFALAVFLALRDETPELVRQYLKPHLTKKLDQAWRRLADAPELLQRLRELSSSTD